MKFLLIGTVLLLCAACSDPNQSRQKLPPNLEVANRDTLLRHTDDGWLYKGQPFSGYMVEKELDGRIVYRLPIMDGRENGLARGWYNTGERLMERWFVAGKKEGSFKQWWPNGRLRYLFHYTHDQLDSTQVVYFPTGKKREESQYQTGEQTGTQRVWNETGKLVSNYVIKNKRTYGLVAVKSCISVGHL